MLCCVLSWVFQLLPLQIIFTWYWHLFQIQSRWPLGILPFVMLMKPLFITIKYYMRKLRRRGNRSILIQVMQTLLRVLSTSEIVPSKDWVAHFLRFVLAPYSSLESARTRNCLASPYRIDINVSFSREDHHGICRFGGYAAILLVDSESLSPMFQEELTNLGVLRTIITRIFSLDCCKSSIPDRWTMRPIRSNTRRACDRCYTQKIRCRRDNQDSRRLAASMLVSYVLAILPYQASVLLPIHADQRTL